MGAESSKKHDNWKSKAEEVESVLHVIDDDTRRITQPQPIKGSKVAIWGKEKIRLGKNH